MNKKNQQSAPSEILSQPVEDRRKLSNVHDTTKKRSVGDRRGQAPYEKNLITNFIKSQEEGRRYQVEYRVQVICQLPSKKKQIFYTQAKNISTTGILLTLENQAHVQLLENTDKITLKFKIEPGTMPEGYEMSVNIPASTARINRAGNTAEVSLVFSIPLTQYATKRRGRYALAISSLLLGMVFLFIILMRSESLLYFRFNHYIYLYSIIISVFLLSRYLFGFLYRAVPIDMDFTPGVSIIIPCFNEEKWIKRTILSCLNQDYPITKLEVIVVDDCSSDHSVEKIKEIVKELHLEGQKFNLSQRLSTVFMPENKGKREALAIGTRMAKHELVVFVDSDSFLDPYAIRNLVAPFSDPKMGGVCGRTDVANTYTNTLTKIQSIRYFVSFRIFKAAEAYFDTVTCLSGPLACYRKEIVLKNLDAWLNDTFLGQKSSLGDDRSLTNYVLANHRTGYQDTAICSTITPNSFNLLSKQQLRWKRSWLRETAVATTFMWKKEPFAAMFFLMEILGTILAPIIIGYNLIYFPIVYRVFPTTFLIGVFLGIFLMSIVQLFFRKSSIWACGMIFYEVLLFWQMPVALVTFWKSTWGTRMTSEDVAEENLKLSRQGARKVNEDLEKAQLVFNKR